MRINVTIAKLQRVGNQPVSIRGGLRYWADGREGGPHGSGQPAQR